MKYSSKVYLTVLLTVGLGIYALYSTSRIIPDIDLLGILLFFSLHIASELLMVKLPKGGSVSFGIAVDVAALISFGPFVAGMIGIGGVIGQSISNGFSLIKSLFNLSLTWLELAVAGFIYQSFGGVYGVFELTTDLLPLFLAAISYLLINVTFSTLIISFANNLQLRSTWESNMKWAVPSLVALVPQGYLLAVIYANLGVIGAFFYFVPLLLARYSFNQYLETRAAHVSVVQALATALEAKDPYTKGHSDRVAKYVEMICRQLKLPEKSIEELVQAAAMHDIGKIGIPEEILNKPNKLSSQEHELITAHPTIGYRILTEVDFLASIADVIKYHHEWFDGSQGYPKELTGDAIPLGARILMVADCFDAMTTDRPYRKALSKEQAIAELVKGSGVQFDPRVVGAFIECITQGDNPNDGSVDNCYYSRVG